MKKIGSYLIAVTLFLFFSATVLQAADYKIRVANPVAADHSWGRAAVVFKEELEKASVERSPWRCIT